jgi:hypothetical protein
MEIMLNGWINILNSEMRDNAKHKNILYLMTHRNITHYNNPNNNRHNKPIL